jgi:HlyD family secretion protein
MEANKKPAIKNRIPKISVPKSKERFKKLSALQKILLIVIVLLVLLGIFRILSVVIQPKEEAAPPVNVTVVTSEMGSIYTTSPITGRIEPAQEALIVPMAQGVVNSVNISLGDFVKKGTILFEIDSAQISAAYSQASAAYQAASTAYNAMRTLYAEGAVSRADLESAKANYTAALAATSQTKEAYDNCRPSAPFDGYITSLNVSVGNQAPTGNLAATLADVSSLKIETGVSEYLINSVISGQEVDIFVNTLGDKPYSGIIKSVSPAPGAGSLTYPMTISIANESGELKAGMFAEVQIKSQSKDEVLLVPSDAPYIKGGTTWIITVDKNNMPIFNEVETGLDNGKYTEIIKGLKPGAQVVLSGQPYVTEGVEVFVIK